MATYSVSRGTFRHSGLSSRVQMCTDSGSFSLSCSRRVCMVSPDSMMSSTMITVLPFISSLKPMSCFTLPVDAVPSYDDILTNEISHGTLIIRMRSAANTNDPLSMASSNGFLPAMSLLIRSATTFTF